MQKLDKCSQFPNIPVFSKLFADFSLFHIFSNHFKFDFQ